MKKMNEDLNCINTMHLHYCMMNAENEAQKKKGANWLKLKAGWQKVGKSNSSIVVQ